MALVSKTFSATGPLTSAGTDAGVVDEDVQMAFLLRDDAHGGLDRRVVSHVELHEVAAEFGSRYLSALGVARPEVDRMPSLDQLSGCLVAKTLVGSGDDCHGQFSVLLCSGPISHSVVFVARAPILNGN